MRYLSKVIVLTLLVFIAVGQAAGAAPLSRLLQLAGQDALPEVRQAAALALTPALVASAAWSNDDLGQLARQGASGELRAAAARALGQRLTERAGSLTQLEKLAASGRFPEVRAAAAQTLRKFLLQSDLSLDALSRLARQGASPELRRAAVPALARGLTDSPGHTTAELLHEASLGDSTAYRLAAAQALAARLTDSALHTLSQVELLAISSGQKVNLPQRIEGANAQLRAAAAGLFQAKLGQASWSLEALEALAADESAAPELRQAAGLVLSQRLLQANLPLAELEQIALDATPQLRAATQEALVQALVGAVGRRALTLQMLTESVAKAPSKELAEAEANAVFILLRAALVAPAAQVSIEAIANGESVQINGLQIDGSLLAFRRVAGEFLTGIYTFFGFGGRLSNPLEQLSAIAGNPRLSEEFRAAAGRALVQVYSAQRGRALQDLAQLSAWLEQLGQELTQGQPDQAQDTLGRVKNLLAAERSLLQLTAEVGGQLTASQLLAEAIPKQVARLEQAVKQGSLLLARSSIGQIERDFQPLRGGLERAPDLSLAELEQIAAQGATAELRQAAGEALSERFLRDSPGLSALEQLALSAGSSELRQAAVAALTLALSTAQPDLDRLYRQALQGATAELRQAAAQALLRSPALTRLSLTQLQALADGASVQIGQLTIDGGNTELRQAFAEALGQLWLSGAEPEQKLEQWAVQGATPQLRQVAAQALALRFARPEGPTLDSLLALAVSGASHELRRAAAEALSRRLIASDLSESDLFALVAEHTRFFGAIPQSSPELSRALAQALANRLANAP